MSRFLAAVVLTTALSPAWALFSDDEARKAILDLRARVERLDIDTGNRLRELEARLDRTEQIARGQLTLQQEIDALRNEVATLRGRLEEQGNELAKALRQQRQQFATVDSRIRTVEPVQVQIDGRTVSVERAEQRMFDAALDRFRQGDFASAARAFEQFDVQYPDSAYAAESAFWLGSSQFALRNYKEAVATQASLVERFPDSGRAPDALLNKAFAEIELGQKRNARRSLELVQERYPGSAAARTAQERERELR